MCATRRGLAGKANIRCTKITAIAVSPVHLCTGVLLLSTSAKPFRGASVWKSYSCILGLSRGKHYILYIILRCNRPSSKLPLSCGLPDFPVFRRRCSGGSSTVFYPRSGQNLANGWKFKMPPGPENRRSVEDIHRIFPTLRALRLRVNAASWCMSCGRMWKVRKKLIGFFLKSRGRA